MKVLKEVVCTKCGFKWFPRVTIPVRCARCGDYHWNEKKERTSARKS